MEIERIHSFLVNPEKGEVQKSPIKGTEVSKKDQSLYKMLSGVFLDAPSECKYEIAFQPNENGKQQNNCKDLIVEYAKSGDYSFGVKIAEHLQGQTTRRSGLGLLFLILGRKDKNTRIVISRFPADNGVLAEESKSKLSVSFVDRIFMKNAKAYKSAVYEGTTPEMDFWLGKAIDKQINSELTISDYWIKNFLESDFATTGERGSKRFAGALRDTINDATTPITIKEELTSALRLTKGINGKIHSASSILSRLGVSEESKEAVKSFMRAELFDEKFKVLFNEMEKLIRFKTIELDNGAYLSAQATTFDEVFVKENVGKNRVEFTTQGKIVTEKVKKSK